MEFILLITSIVIILQLSYVIKVVQPSTTMKGNHAYVDTSALMDGRILTIASTGFIPTKLVITKSVIAELQYLADQGDSEKRVRARAGLDSVRELQDLPTTTVEIFDDGPLENGGVDGRLVSLARKNGGMLCTIDFNLNKVAKIENVFVLNINELAQNIRMAFLPGETFELMLTQKGQNSSQAVGYLEDGTMVVVEEASRYIGSKAKIEFIRSLQTAAGRMMFARLSDDQEPQKYAPKVANGKPSQQRHSISSKNATTKKGNGRKKPDTKRTNEDNLIQLLNDQDR